jgi:glutamyl-tRNA synthetase
VAAQGKIEYSVTPRLRFAPSPTGFLHVGGARTALFNWLYARRHGGAFILRIEDTDVERSQAEMVTGILDGLRWLGIDWDEGPEVGGPHAPYFQSERLERYRAAAKQLLDSGQAFLDEGAIRFKVPAGKTSFTDSVHGPIEFDNEHIESFVILRSDTHPTYHLSVVVDDIDMAITHVVRGDDHISNTPKQVLLYNAFGKTPPSFAHVPLIMGPDKQRLSKRHGATSVMEYEKQGYLPEAMFNFLALLGWGTGSNDELFTRQELIHRFNLEGISGGNAVFNTEKLDWFNHQHLSRLADDELIARLRGLGLGAWGLGPDQKTRAILQLLRPRCKKLTDFPDQMRPFFEDPSQYDAEAVKKHLSVPGTKDHLKALRDTLAKTEWSEASLEKALRDLADARTVKAGMLIHGTRIAMTGRMVSPGLFEMLVLLGRDTVLRRLDRLAETL